MQAEFTSALMQSLERLDEASWRGMLILRLDERHHRVCVIEILTR